MSAIHLTSRRTSHGFTIVELLIVIIVIAILAAITIVAYQGVQQRANNAAILSAASQSLKMVKAYVAANGVYPTTDNWACITVDKGCRLSGPVVPTSSTLVPNLLTVGTLPKNVPGPTDYRYGITYNYDATRTVDGVAQPLALHYFLYGVSQSCSLPGVLTSAYPSSVSSTTGYTQANDGGSGMTYCQISVPGPSA